MNDKLRIKYLKALNLYRDKEYKSAFKLIKNIGVRNTTFKSKEITSAILNYKIRHNLILSKKEKIKRLENLYNNGQYSLFMSEFEDKLSPKILINKALIKIKSNEPNEGLRILRKMLDKKLMVMVNSDDPAYFGGYLNKNFIEVQKALNLSYEEVKTLLVNSFKSSFMKDTKKEEWISKII